MIGCGKTDPPEAFRKVCFAAIFKTVGTETEMNEDDKREIAIGRAVAFCMCLWRFAKRFLLCSLIALAVLLIIGRPLYLAPLFGLAGAAVWTAVVRLFYLMLISFGRNSGS